MLRIALHPDDLLRPGLREASLRGIDAALEAGVVALTYGDLLDTNPTHVDLADQTTPDGVLVVGQLRRTATDR